MKATIHNMKRVAHQLGVVAYSPDTGEVYSATPGDYFYHHDNYCLEDAEGNPMVLARKSTRYVQVRA